MNDVAKGHTVQRFDQELTLVRDQVLAMGKRVLKQVSAASGALTEGEVNLARQVVDRERQIDRQEMAIDEGIFNIIAKRQPAAIDLRLVMALSKCTGYLEQAGDKAEQIAWCALRIREREGREAVPRTLHHVRRLQGIATRLLGLSLAALAEVNVDKALDVFREEVELEEEFDAGMRHLMTFILGDATLTGQVIEVVFALRALVAIGDKASNIAEQVIFVAKGTDVRYRNKEILIATLSQEQETGDGISR
ncbi:MAG: phosphate signaling complex protein PhoU [Chromatiaceae bacterium]